MSKSTFKLKVILLFSIIILSFITFAYGYFYSYDQQGGDIMLTSSCFDVSFTDGQSINMSSALPISDAQGIYERPYEFTITNNCTYDMSIKTLVEVPKTAIDNEYIKFMYNNETIGKITDQEISGLETNEYQARRILGVDIVKAKTSVTKELRFWLDENTDIENVRNKSWVAKIIVESGVNNADKA